MMWLTILPLIIDVIKEASKLIASLEDDSEKQQAKIELRSVLGDYSVHQDIETLRSNIQQVGNGGAKK